MPHPSGEARIRGGRNARRLHRVVRRLSWGPRRSTWSGYYADNAYAEQEAQKLRFVSEMAAERD